MTITTPNGADALQEGNTVYVLNTRGSNRWWASVQPGQDDEGKRTSDDECKQIAHAIRAALAAAQEAPAQAAQAVSDEPDWRHPKIQGLIGSEARLRITIDLMWQILEDPNQEFTASDMEYWDTIHDKLKAALSAAPQPAQQPLAYEHKAILKKCRNKASRWALEARIPEAGVFGEIAQDLDYLCGQLGARHD